MRCFKRTEPTVVLAVIVCVAAGSSGQGCSADEGDHTVVAGERGLLAGGEVRAWAWVEHTGEVSAVGLTMDDQASATGRRASLDLAFPEVARQATFFDHLRIRFNPDPHALEGVAGGAHFDVHLYGIDAATREAIDCAAEPRPASLPHGYSVAGTAVEPKGSCVPQRGVRSVNLNALRLFGGPAQPTKTLVLGYHAGKLAFVEPVISKALIVDHEMFDLQVPQPDGLGGRAYPKSLQTVYRTSTGEYHLVFTAFHAAGRE